MDYCGIDLSPGSSAVVFIDSLGSTASYKHISIEDAKRDFRARMSMATQIIDQLITRPRLIGLEDYALGPGQHVSYQIAETAALVKSFIVESGYPLALIHPRKRQSYVLRQKKVTKQDVIDWAAKNGFSPPVKTRGRDGYKKREREDLADAFVLAAMARDLAMYLSEQSLPVKGHLFLDPETGLAFNEYIRFNCEKVMEVA